MQRTIGRERDKRIDFARGLALLCIFIDHIPRNPLARLTAQNFGLSDASEVFVFLAGLSAALAYGPQANSDGVRAVLPRILARAQTIFLTHLSLVGVLVLFGAALRAVNGSDASIAATPLAHFEGNFVAQTLSAMCLVLQPQYLDILPLYVVLFVGVLPLFLWLARGSLARALACSLALWWLAGSYNLHLPSQRPGGWFFNPFAWQLCFSAGLALGLLRIRNQQASRQLFFKVAASLFLLVSFMATAPWTLLPVEAVKTWRIVEAVTLHNMSKTNLSGWRILHLISLIYMAGVLIPREHKQLSSRALDWIIRLGRRSLPAFALTTLLSHVATAVTAAYGFGLTVTLGVTFAGLFILYVFAAYTEKDHWKRLSERPTPLARHSLLILRPSQSRGLRLACAVVLATIIVSTPSNAAGTMEYITLRSSTSGRQFSSAIYLPTRGRLLREIPVIYILHGAGSSGADIVERGEVIETIERLTGRGLMPPALIVMPDAADCWWVDSSRCNAETFFLNELHPFIQSHYAISQRREDTMIIGISAGGFGALRFALRKPNLIGRVALLSPAIYMDEPPQFSGVRQKSPFVRPDGTFDIALWHSTNYPALLPAYLSQRERVRIYLASGDADPYGIAIEIARLHQQLLYVPNQIVQLRISGGVHAWSYWKSALQQALAECFFSEMSAPPLSAAAVRSTPQVPEFGRW